MNKINITIQVKKSFHARVQARAKEEGRSMANWIKRVLEKELNKTVD